MSNKIDLNFGGGYFRLAIKMVLEKKIARQLKVKQTNVQLSSGSNGSLRFLFMALALKSWQKNYRPPTAILGVPNYFDTLKFLQASGYIFNGIKRNKNFSFPLPKFIKKIKKIKPDLIILTTPNNPTGLPLLTEEIQSIINQAPQTSVVIIDRTCLNTRPEISTAKLLKQYAGKNLIILESFSKSHGLSAERVGYFVTNNNQLGKYLDRFYDDGWVNAEAMERLNKIIDNKRIVRKNSVEISKSIKYLNAYEREHPGFKCTNTSSNFALIRLKPKLANKMKQKFLFASGDKFKLKDSGIYRINISSAVRIKKFLLEYDKLSKANV